MTDERRCALCGEPCTGARMTIHGLDGEEFHTTCLPPLPAANVQRILNIVWPGEYEADVEEIERRRAEWERRYRAARRRAGRRVPR